MLVQEDLALQFGKWTGKSLWIVGCGPSLDDLDLKCLMQKNVFALNAAIYALASKGAIPNTWWFYRDRRVGPEVAPHLFILKWNPWRIITTPKSFTYWKDQTRTMPKSCFVQYYEETSVVHQRSIIEDALQIAQRMGFSKVYLAGVDHALKTGEPYAKVLRWKECYWMDRQKPPQKSAALESMSRGLEALLPTLSGMEIVNTSRIYPRGILPFVSYHDCLQADV